MRPTQTAALALALAIVALPQSSCPAQNAAGQTAPGGASGGQSVNDLRQEIDRLRAEAAKRQADLDAALERIKALEKQLADAKAAGTSPAGPAANQPAAPVPPPVPADPTIGPGGLLASLQADYLAAFPQIPDTKDQQRFNLHLRALDGWCIRANRDGIKQYQWVGRIDPASVAASQRTVAFVAIFKNGIREFKVPCSMDLSTFARVRTRDGVVADDVVFTGIVKPRLAVNSRRPQPSAFEVPPMVAPYVEFLYDFDVKSVVPASGPGAPAR
jgi:hypothetical protein